MSDLRRFPAFESLSPAALELLDGRAQRLRLPAGRWLVRPGRSLSAHYFLLEGRVSIRQGGRPETVAAGSVRARSPIYPGSDAAETLTPALFLAIDPVWLEAFAEQAPPGLPEVGCDPGSWQQRFLQSPIMQRLEPAAWQRILRAMAGQRHFPGDRVIVAGAPADCCYVLCSGSAEVVSAGGGRLARLTPGSLFGEDALVTGRVRSATVTMLEAGITVWLPAERFEAWLLSVVVRPVSPQERRRPLRLGPPGAPDCIAISRIRAAAADLARDEAYGILGGNPRERALAAFLLAQQGIDAAPVEG